MSLKRKAEELDGKIEKKHKAITDFFPKITNNEEKQSLSISQEASQEQFVFTATPPKSERKKDDIWRNKKGEWKIWNGKQYRDVCEECKVKQPTYGIIREDGSRWKRWCKPCAEEKHPDEYIDFHLKCEDCKVAQAMYGIVRENSTNWYRWCKGCADANHANEFIDFHLKCEDCNVTSRNYGMIRDDGTKWYRWCKPCAKSKHADEYIDFQLKCEDCKVIIPTYGTIREDGTNWRRWCKGCAEEKHEDECVNFTSKCEDCKTKKPNHGIVRENGTKWYRWCKTCAEKTHAGEYADFNRKCIQGCGKYSQAGDYCITCHPDYIPVLSGASKQACEFIDELERQLNLDKHYDVLIRDIAGDEKKIDGTKYRVDGFVTEGKLPFISKSKGTVVEFHGVKFHGYPDNEHKDEQNHLGQRYGELYDKTIKREQEISALGYTIVRIFSTQYEEWKKHRVGMSLLSYCTVM